MTTNKKITLLCLSLVNLTAYLTMSIIAPFFPYEANMKGMRSSLAGFVFSVYAFVMMVSSPFLGKILPTVGAKFMLLSGIWFAGCSNVLFGVLEYVNDATMFTVLCFVVRAVGAFGAASFSTASYTYVIHLFPDNVGLAFGLTETCVGVGMSLGPAVGGLLYGLGGYGLPFYVLGSFVLATGPLCWMFVDAIDIDVDSDDSSCSSSTMTSTTESSKATYFNVIFNPKVLVMCIVLATATTTQGFLDPTIEPHFRQYGIHPEYVGLVFLVMSASYAISSPISGWVAGKIESKAPLMVIGLMMTSFAYVLLGPSKFLQLEPTFWLSAVSMMIIGLAYSLAFIPTFEYILEAVIEKGLPDDVKTYSLVSGLWSCVNSLGEVTGAGMGGIFIDYFSFTFGANSIAIWTMGVAVLLLLTYLWEVCCVNPSSLLASKKEFNNSNFKIAAGKMRPRRGFSISDRTTREWLMSTERTHLLRNESNNNRRHHHRRSLHNNNNNNILHPEDYQYHTRKNYCAFKEEDTLNNNYGYTEVVFHHRPHDLHHGKLDSHAYKDHQLVLSGEEVKEDQTALLKPDSVNQSPSNHTRHFSLNGPKRVGTLDPRSQTPHPAPQLIFDREWKHNQFNRTIP